MLLLIDGNDSSHSTRQLHYIELHVAHHHQQWRLISGILCVQTIVLYALHNQTINQSLQCVWY